jgi:hypothetical protein
MTTKPHHDIRSLATDARRVLDAAQADVGDKSFAKYVDKPSLAALLHDVEALEAGVGGRAARHHGQVAAGAHTAQIRANIAGVVEHAREQAHLAFPSDTAMQHAFGVGARLVLSSTNAMADVADGLLASAAAHASEAKKVGLDAHGVHDLEAMLHALHGADLAHVHAETARHTTATTLDSLAHKVSAEVAWIRRAAHFAFAADQTRLDRYAHTLPRHAITPRATTTTPAH